MVHRFSSVGETGSQEREKRKNTFASHFGQLTDDERKKFDELMETVYEQRDLTGLHKGGIEELRWEKLPLFMKDKNIKSLKDPNALVRWINRIASAILAILPKKNIPEDSEWTGPGGRGMII